MNGASLHVANGQETWSMATAAGNLPIIRGIDIPDLQKALFFAGFGAAGAFAGELLFEPFHAMPGQPSSGR